MKRALHNLSHEHLTTFNMGELVPLACYEGLPNDLLRGSTSMLLRTQPQLAPTMHKVRVGIYHFAVPLRLLMDDWEQFRTGTSGNDTPDTTVFPTIESPSDTGFAVGSLAHRLGVQPGVPNKTVSALPFRAYQLVYNTYFRDKDLDPEASLSTASGVDVSTSRDLQMASWEKDYFTSARPYPQKGPAISIPLTGDAPVTGIGILNSDNAPGGSTGTYKTGPGETASFTTPWAAASDSVGIKVANVAGTNYPDINADMSGVSAVNIEDLRDASAMQRFAELIAKFGHTLPEFYRLFGVAPQDSRMQWPEMIGSGYSTIQFSEVLQTAEGNDPVGELRGHGIAKARSNRFKYFVQEDCIILTLACVRPQTVYMNGCQKMWNRRSRWDYFMPALQNLGQQPILNKEVNLAHASPDGVFGYQDQYDEYRRIPNRVSGEFYDTLNFWHMARDVPNTAALNSSFVKANPTNRTFATDADQLQCRVDNSIKAKRLVFKTSRPSLK